MADGFHFMAAAPIDQRSTCRQRGACVPFGQIQDVHADPYRPELGA
jgi:hypothetical protein